MSSTNKTTNYNLSQYIGSDKPTYLSDYNSDMYKIDAQMKINADNIATAINGVETATSTANSANATATQANSTATQANSTANSASTTAGNAQSTANSALATATSAQTTANTALGNVEKLNLETFTSIGSSDITTNNVSNANVNLTLATNSDSSVFKLYGQVTCNLTNPNSEGYISYMSSLRPTSDFTVTGAGNITFENSGTITAIRIASFTVKTNGEIRVIIGKYGSSASELKRVMLNASLYFAKDFGDSPVQA